MTSMKFRVGDRIKLRKDLNHDAEKFRNWYYDHPDDPGVVREVETADSSYLVSVGGFEYWIGDEQVEEAQEAVNHPSHYNRGGIEAIDAIEAWGLGFNLGNTVKYISRAGVKDPDKRTEDLEKALWYLKRELGL